MDKHFRIGIISGKLGDVDGVSLEVDKWIRVLTELGHTVFTIAGAYKNPLKSIPPENQLTLEKIGFSTTEQQYYAKLVFPHLNRNPVHLNNITKNDIVERLTVSGEQVAAKLYEYIQDFNIDVIVAANTNAIPMTLLGGMGVYKLATERRVAAILHHHDFWWERSRFSNNRIESLLTKIMPPSDLGIEHVVLSSYAAHILSSIKRVHPSVIPNCEDFDKPTVPDEYNGNFRSDFGFRDDDILIVQPTRIIRRKRVEDSIELASRLLKRYPDFSGRVHFIISLYQGDEPDENYVRDIRSMADTGNVPLHLISDRVSSVRGEDDRGERIYTNRDVLVNADLVTYLPIWEGFGNALLETMAARVPLAVTTYLVYKTDIKGTGLNNIEIRDSYDENGRLRIPDEAVEEVYRMLTDAGERSKRTNENFEIARSEFGIDTLRNRLMKVLSEYADEIRASRKRLKKSKILYSV